MFTICVPLLSRWSSKLIFWIYGEVQINFLLLLALGMNGPIVNIEMLTLNKNGGQFKHHNFWQLSPCNFKSILQSHRTSLEEGTAVALWLEKDCILHNGVDKTDISEVLIKSCVNARNPYDSFLDG